MPPSAVTRPEHLLSPEASPQHMRAGGQGRRPLLSEGMPVHPTLTGELRGLAHGRCPVWQVATSE